MKYFIQTYGCQMNLADSEKIKTVIQNMGYKPAPTINGAGLIIFNMCSIRQTAVDKIFGKMKALGILKKKNSKIRTIITGCILKNDIKKFQKHFDFILPIKTLNNWEKILNQKKDFDFLDPRDDKFNKKFNTSYLKNKSISENDFSASIPISTGCNNFCSYCVVPYVRGPLICRPHQEIIKEAKNFVKQGFKEIWLLGQNVNDYQSPTNKNIDFPKLLENINEVPGDFWIRFTSSHPKNFTDKLIEVMAQKNHVTEYLNLPIQSGDDEILKKMNRPYTVSKYKKIIDKIRKKIPDISLSTDAIVGFPGETRQQFKNTKNTFKEIGFDMAYILKYSKRNQTKANNFKNQIDKKIKEERYRELTEIVGSAGLKKNKQYENQTLKVLVSTKRNEFLIGKTRHYKTVKIKGSENLIGKFVNVKITKALPWGLRGELITEKPKLIVVLGPTAVGKTNLSIKLAKKFNGEIISADSRQVYRGMNIGSGKITKKEMEGIPHYLLDVANPKKRFSLAEYKQLADKAIEKIIKKKKNPFLVGGTGFYIQAVVDNIIIPEVKPDWNLRKILEKLTTKELFSLLKKKDRRRAITSNIDKNNRRRLIRALEIVLKTGKTVPDLQSKPCFDVLMIGVNKSPEKLKKLIQKRLDKRLKNGMITEVKKLKKQGLSWKRLEEFGLEYKLIAQYLQNKISKEKMIERIQIESEQYAKRQMTWFKRDKRIHWIKNQKQAEKLIKAFLI